jgi:hypothetical protein
MITRAIKRVANGNEDVEDDLISANMAFSIRAWQHFATVLLEKLSFRNDSIFGKVKSMFYRFEFQDAGALGNKPHVHCGITLEDEPAETSVARISCESATFSSPAYKSDYQSLLAEGIVADEYDYNSWQTLVKSVQVHDCAKVQNRCMKVIQCAAIVDRSILQVAHVFHIAQYW